MTVLVLGALPRSLINFRGHLLQSLRASGHRVVAAASGEDPSTQANLYAMGVVYQPIRMTRTGMNPLADAIAFLDVFRLIRRVRPDVVLCYTIKPVIHGGLAARLCGVPSRYALITGLGYAFGDDTSSRRRVAGVIASLLYRLSLGRYRRVFFQNPDDRDALLSMRLVSPAQAVVVSGSGVDLEHFRLAPIRRNARGIRFLLIARLLREKGIREFVEAARLVRSNHPDAEFHMVGSFDSNPSSFTPRQIGNWQDEGLIRFHGQQQDVRPFIRECDVYVLPSYREGTPRTVLEAMAMGRPIITTSAAGCRETIRRVADAANPANHSQEPMAIGSNGLLVPPRDVGALAHAMEFFLQDPDRIALMGHASRRYAEERFDVHSVNAVMLREMGLSYVPTLAEASC